MVNQGGKTCVKIWTGCDADVCHGQDGQAAATTVYPFQIHLLLPFIPFFPPSRFLLSEKSISLENKEDFFLGGKRISFAEEMDFFCERAHFLALSRFAPPSKSQPHWDSWKEKKFNLGFTWRQMLMQKKLWILNENSWQWRPQPSSAAWPRAEESFQNLKRPN